jgi:hypothetical protein
MDRSQSVYQRHEGKEHHHEAKNAERDEADCNPNISEQGVLGHRSVIVAPNHAESTV